MKYEFRHSIIPMGKADAAAENGFSSEIFGFGFVCKSIGTLWAKKRIQKWRIIS